MDVSRTTYQSERQLGNKQYATGEELSIRVISTVFNIMRFHKNAFPRKAFQQKAFHKMLSTKCRKITMGKKQGRLGYSFFMCDVLHGNS